MKKIRKFEVSVDAIMAIFLALMGIFVFANVILRYFFNSGLTWAEELSRFLLVWIVFLGAVGAMKDNKHLGFTAVIQRLPRPLKKVVYILANCFVIGCLYVFFTGSLEMTLMTTKTLSPATGLPLSYMYAVGIVSSVGMFLVVCCNLYRAFFSTADVDSLISPGSKQDANAAKDSAKDEVTT